MKDLRDLKDLTIHDVKPMSETRLHDGKVRSERILAIISDTMYLLIESQLPHKTDNMKFERYPCTWGPTCLLNSVPGERAAGRSRAYRTGYAVQKTGMCMEDSVTKRVPAHACILNSVPGERSAGLNRWTMRRQSTRPSSGCASTFQSCWRAGRACFCDTFR